MTENVSDFTKYLISHFYCNIYKPRIASTHVRRNWRSASKTSTNVFIHMFDCWSVQSSVRSATLEHESVFESEHCDVTVSGHEHSGSSLRTLSRSRVAPRGRAVADESKPQGAGRLSRSLSLSSSAVIAPDGTRAAQSSKSLTSPTSKASSRRLLPSSCRRVTVVTSTPPPYVAVLLLCFSLFQLLLVNLLQLASCKSSNIKLNICHCRDILVSLLCI